MGEPEVKVCEICHTRPIEYGRVCDECKRMPPADETISNWLKEVDQFARDNPDFVPESAGVVRPLGGWYHCPDHGDHQGVRIGKAWSRQCPQCVHERRTEAIRKRRAEQRKPKSEIAPAAESEPPIKDTPQNRDGFRVLVDFSDCPWVVGLVRKESVLDLGTWVKRKVASALLDNLTEAELRLLILGSLV